MNSVGQAKALPRWYRTSPLLLIPMVYGSGVASPKTWGGKVYDFRRITLFYLEKRLSKHKMPIFSENLRGEWPFGPPGYTYAVWSLLQNVSVAQKNRAPVMLSSTV